MGEFKLDEGYVEVSERILEFREKYPKGSLQCEIVPVPEPFAGKFLAVRATAYRTPDDERPGVGLAWEPVPGKTPFTKDSELSNAETSAWGRALIAVGAADAKRGIASANEVRNRKATSERPKSTQKPPADPNGFSCPVLSPEGWPCIRPTAHKPESKGHFFKKPDGYSDDSVPSAKPPQVSAAAQEAGAASSPPPLFPEGE
jgi:hypothetical protein